MGVSRRVRRWWKSRVPLVEVVGPWDRQQGLLSGYPLLVGWLLGQAGAVESRL